MLLIHYMWVTSLHYEARYEADDVTHYVFKGIHFLLLVGVGAASKRFSIFECLIVKEKTQGVTRSRSIHRVRVLRRS